MQNLSKADYSGYLKGITNKVKQYALNLSEIELKVEEATNNEPWGPHGTVMAEIAKAAYDVEGYKQIMGVIARRLQDTGESWRHVYKSLLLLEFMAKHGPQKVVEELVSNVTVVEKLQSFQHKDKNGKDWGLNVRQRAKELANLVLDAERIRAERAKAKGNEAKYKGLSSADWRSGAVSSSKTGFGGGGGGLDAGFGGARLHDDENFDYGSLTRGRGKGTGLGSGAGGKAPGDDAVAATKARIDALRKDGDLDQSPRKTDAIPAVSASKPPARPSTAVAAAEASQRQPKKLSDVKPTVQLSLGNFAPPPSAARPAATPAATSAGKLAVADGPPSPQAATAKAAAADVGDLLGGISLDSPTASSAGAQAAAPAAAGPSDWSQFAAPTSAAAPADDPFASFGERQSPTKAKPPAATADPFGSDPFGSATASGVAQPADPFAASAPTQSRPPTDPFAVSAPAAPAVADPFVDFAAAPRSAGSKLVASDPFAASSNGNTPGLPGKPGSMQVRV